ncbi:conserved hypothetical protein [Crocosphaera subtropica ATCC 51142]|uniref:Ferric oxidoreductase domain-containing protein n=1 Tax=Crocosphaera subtropica (strain ATCC 51142 / BH68) TaxID=43989 RepID=B1WQX4_CROS5|nr:hypothetical protein [Crocosphaera subtropica]ACB53426.1 conserved hypothetical protein [Crocosphaera subtropica ATCC 51142]
MNTKVDYQTQIITLWATFLLGLLFHTQLGLMPLFHGQEIAHSHDTSDISGILWLMLLFFIIPMFAMIGTLFTQSKQFRVGHFWLSIVYSVLNLSHITADLFVTPIAWYQILLMVILFVIGLLLNLVSWQWMKSKPNRQKTSDSLLEVG